MTTVLLAAGDASGDLHCAQLVEALRARRPGTRFVGMGGPAMEKAGVELCVDQRALAVGGLVELGSSLPRIASAWRRLARALASEGPELVVLVDSGGFNLPFARRVRRRSDARILYYVTPQVWAWRRGRIRKLARRVDRLAVIFPFEPAVYREAGVRVDFVGHPLVEPLADYARREDRGGARGALGLDPEPPLVALLPGSRRNEVARQLPIQLDAARIVHARDARVGFALALASSIERRQVDDAIARASLPSQLRLRVVTDQTHRAIRAADVVLAKPGTVTVEATLLERPMVVMGLVNAITAFVLRRAVSVPFYAMPNLIAGEEIVPELLQEDARPERIAEAVLALLAGPDRERQLERLATVRSALAGGGGARAAARVAEEMLGTRRTT